MPCEHYKDALIEAAVTAATPQGQLRAHLDECASCRAAFAQEQSLFAAIDSGLHASANAEVPPSLLPRIRAAIEQETSSKRGWFSDALVFATAATILLAFLTARTFWRTNHGQEPLNTTVKTNAPLLKPVPSQAPKRDSEPLANSFSSARATTARNSPQARQIATSLANPEVLVPRDQDSLLVNYAEQWYRQKRAPLVAGQAADSALELLQVPPIQIDLLDVKPLAAENSQ